MEYRRLGKSGLKISEIGIGINAFGGRTDGWISIKAVGKLLTLGINFIDIADIYNQGLLPGHSYYITHMIPLKEFFIKNHTT